MTDKKLNMNLQYFAEGGNGGEGAGAENGEGNNGGAGGQAGQNNNASGAPTGNQVTFSEEQQQAMNATIQTRISQEHAKWEKSQTQTISDAVNQGIEDYKAKLNMSPEQLAELEKDEKDKKLTDLENQLAQRDRKDHALKVATEKEFPAELIDLVVGDTDELTDKRIDTTSKILNKLVQASVEERLKGKGTPGEGGGSNGNEAGAYGKRLAEKYNQKQPDNPYFK